jgi:hypothetical protein
MLDLVSYISRQESVANTILKVVAAREAQTRYCLLSPQTREIPVKVFSCRNVVMCKKVQNVLFGNVFTLSALSLLLVGNSRRKFKLPPCATPDLRACHGGR